MATIYEQHDKAFAKVSAFVIVRDGEKVATVAIKFPADGAGRLYAYVHWLGFPLVRGFANGYGYDKRSAAVRAAVAPYLKSEPGDGKAVLWAFALALTQNDGGDWTRDLEKAGFQVWQAV